MTRCLYAAAAGLLLAAVFAVPLAELAPPVGTLSVGCMYGSVRVVHQHRLGPWRWTTVTCEGVKGLWL